MERLEPRRLFANVNVNLNAVQQTMEDLGGAYSRSPFEEAPSRDHIAKFTFENLKPNIVRVPIPLPDWEPVNDNADPLGRRKAGFKRTGQNLEILKMMQEFDRRGMTIIASVYRAPNWLVSNPHKTDHRVVPREKWAELTESMSSFLEAAKNEFGVTVDYVSFNEANGGYTLLFTAQEHGDFIAAAAPQMKARGLTPKWIVGETYQVRGTVEYARSILNHPGARPYLGPVAFHTWWSWFVPSSEWKAIGQLAKQYNKPLWSTEMGYDSLLWQRNPGIFPKWEFAEKIANVYHQAITQAGVSVGLYWQYQNDFPLMSKGALTQYPVYYTVKGMVQNFGKGTQIVTASSNKSTVLAMAGKNPTTNVFSMQMVNTAASAEHVTLTGLPNQQITLYRTTAKEKYKKIAAFTPVNGKLTLTLNADSVNILRSRLTTPPTPRPPASRPPAAALAAPTPVFSTKPLRQGLLHEDRELV
jgi:hypothetical protein